MVSYPVKLTLVGVGIFAGVGLLCLVGTAASNSDVAKAPAVSSSASAPAPSTTAPTTAAPEPTKPAEAKPGAVAVSATVTEFVPGVLSDGLPHTALMVTLTNNSPRTVSSNTLYFSVTDSNGIKHTPDLAAADNEMELSELAQGETAVGVVSFKGAFTPAKITFSDFRVNVSSQIK